MSPKDESSSSLRPNQLITSEGGNPDIVNHETTDYENGYRSGDDGNDENQKNIKKIETWRRKLERIQEWWKDNDFFSFQINAAWTAAATAIFILAVATTAYHRAGRRRQRRLLAQALHQSIDIIPSSSVSLLAAPIKRSSFSLLWLLWNALRRFKESDSARRRNIVNVSLSMLQLAARQGLIKKALVGSGEILYQDRATIHTSNSSWKRTLLPPNSPGIQGDLLELLSKHGCDDVAALPESLSSRLATPILAALPFVYLALVYKIFKNIHNGGGNDLKLLENGATNSTRFSDVAGLETILPEIQEIVLYLKHSQKYRALGAHPPRGILLYGPPGGGKTLLARALAGEANAAFLACSGSDFCEMYVGRGAARVRSLFERARSQALLQRTHRSSSWWWKRLVASSTLTSPPEGPPPTAILFIDEFDALAKSRAYGAGASNGNDERESTLNQLLTEMDGFASSSSSSSFSSSNDNQVTIIVVAATNRPDVLDPAILRRFDRQIHVSYPSANGRRDIFKVHAARSASFMEEIDWNLLASDEWTADFSGSDLRNVVNDAALLAVREQSPRVQQSHLEHAIQRTRQMKCREGLAGNQRSSHQQSFLYIPPNNS